MGKNGEKNLQTFVLGVGVLSRNFVPGVGLLNENFNGPVVSPGGGWQLVKLIAA